MAGLNKNTPTPTELTVHQGSKQLEIAYSDGQRFSIPFEMLRVFSPSAEVQGHGPGQETLQTGKRGVGILSLDPVGNYAVQPHFDDGHSTGIFTWEYLYHLGADRDGLWAQYLSKLESAKLDRDTPMRSQSGHPDEGPSCGHDH
jgi:DUF971 family protein